MKVTDPVGVPAPDVTVAVNVTDWPYVEGFGAAVRAVEVVAVDTVWVSVLEVLVAKVGAPLYWATTGWAPMVKVLVLNVATPLPLRLTVPTFDPSMLKVTDPVGVPAPDVTVAVNVTDWPTAEGLRLDVRAVVVVAATTWVRVFDVLPAKFPFVPYWATTA
jgi:hypothetical protein